MAHLLIVEDDELLRDGLSAQLMQAGHRTDTAADGEQALHLLQTVSFDGMVLDLGLPKIDGVSVLERWRREGRPHRRANVIAINQIEPVVPQPRDHTGSHLLQ